jgi:hypothetical protein
MSSNLAPAESSQQPYAGLSNILQAALQLSSNPDKGRPANFMLPQVQSRLRLAEHFYQTEGDATNVCDVPIELIARRLIVECPDSALREDIEDFILENGLEDTVGELWRTMRVYGQAFPYESWDEGGKDLSAIVNLYPLHVHVGYNWGYALGSEVVGEKSWTRELVETRLPPAMHRPLLRHWNENPPPWGGASEQAMGMPLSGDVLRPVRDKDFNWTRYSMPMLSRGFRDLTSRVVHEDAIRAVTEGYRYQLWVFKLGDAEHPPLPQEISALKSALAGVSGERTGMLVWRDSPMSVEVFVPQGLDTLMGNDYLAYLTKSFFRKMGITSQVVSGEIPGTLGGTGGGRGSTEIDVQIYIERARYQADQITRWVEYIARKWALANLKAKKPLAKMHIRFAPNTLEMSQRIEKVFLPIYMAGALSVRTLQGAAGLTYESELANKKDEKKDGELFSPPASFKQLTVNPEGETKEVAQSKPQGSPKAAEEIGNKMNKGQRKPKTPVKPVVKDENESPK